MEMAALSRSYLGMVHANSFTTDLLTLTSPGTSSTATKDNAAATEMSALDYAYVDAINIEAFMAKHPLATAIGKMVLFSTVGILLGHPDLVQNIGHGITALTHQLFHPGNMQPGGSHAHVPGVLSGHVHDGGAQPTETPTPPSAPPFKCSDPGQSEFPGSVKIPAGSYLSKEVGNVHDIKWDVVRGAGDGRYNIWKTAVESIKGNPSNADKVQPDQWVVLPQKETCNLLGALKDNITELNLQGSIFGGGNVPSIVLGTPTAESPLPVALGKNFWIAPAVTGLALVVFLVAGTIIHNRTKD